MVSRKFFLSEGQEGELQTFVQEDMLIDGELAMDDRGHFLIQAVCGDDAYVLFDEIGKGCAAMLRKLNCFLNIVMGSFIGVFIGFEIYKFWHFKIYPNLYAMQSAPWYTELLLDGVLVTVFVIVCITLKLIILRKLNP